MPGQCSALQHGVQLQCGVQLHACVDGQTGSRLMLQCTLSEVTSY